CLVLPQYADDLFVCETIALHPLVLSNGPELTSKWIISTGQGHQVKPVLPGKWSKVSYEDNSLPSEAASSITPAIADAFVPVEVC
ncbi:hypothetical protein ELI49_38440, partial [Rhizobium ruizarguesonis]|uniref:hypothetical protein n=1 Tax=Rhizobium ruizarguesonis TaxID=2081791 RepID=UPI0010322576